MWRVEMHCLDTAASLACNGALPRASSYARAAYASSLYTGGFYLPFTLSDLLASAARMACARDTRLYRLALAAPVRIGPARPSSVIDAEFIVENAAL